MSLKITGKIPSGKHLQRIRQSPNYKQKGFQNLSDTPMMSDDVSYWKMTKDFFSRHKDKAPTSALPTVKTDLKNLNSASPVIIWFGHSSYFIRIQNRNILVDPVLSGNASPFSFMIKAFPGSDVYGVNDLPPIDYLILTHDHYDHLDYKTIRELKGKVSKIYCSLGMASHLVYWGIDENIITEMDWWQSAILDENITLTAAPARHFSGRGIKRFQTLWSSFILKTPKYSLYLGGDSGYDEHFKKIGEQYGPFDIAILEAGQYNAFWPLIHMTPEETVQAALDLKAGILFPVHWGKFSLAMHPWNEPIQRVIAKSANLSLQVTMPRIGEPLILGQDYSLDPWWDF